MDFSALIVLATLATPPGADSAASEVDLLAIARLGQLTAPPLVTLQDESADDTTSSTTSLDNIAVKPDYGTKDTWRWVIHGGGGVDVEDSGNTMWLGGVAFNYFVFEDFSVNFEFNGIYFAQEDDDAFGFNFNLLARWHFLVRDNWTLYADGGAGLLGTTDKVPGPDDDEPRGGANFNFTPQIGAGFSYEFEDKNRLLVGFRWHHISNAETSQPNPPRDSILVYAGLSMPF